MEKTRCDWSFKIQIRFLLWWNRTHVGFQIMYYDWSEFFKNVSFYGHVNPTWGLKVTLYDWSELFQICALIWQG